MTDIWVVGATGRSGQAIATELAARGADAVWVGRDAQRLAQVAGGGRTHVAATVAQLAEDIALRRPGVVVNTVGPFAATATQTARACLDAGSHYVDLANELEPVCAVLNLDADAIGARRTLVTGSGFGVLATEALVVGLVEGRPGAARVRVDAMPVVDALGPAVLASVIDSLAAGGRRYAGGALVRARLGSDFEKLTLPDGRVVGTVGVPTGELEAARRASGAADVVAASSEVPAARLARAALPIL